jgi:amino acid adenylation domain-containing protein
MTTYGDLAARIDAIARGLRARGVGRESLVAIDLPRSAERVAAVLAVSRAGAAWLPVGSDWPAARVAAVLEDARPALLIGAGAPPPGAPAATLAALAREEESAGELEAPRPADLAYVLYTSGSTGVPKGVMVEHRALANLLAWSRRAYPLGPGDRVLQKAPLEFDASVWEIFAPLVAGATLVVAPPEIERDPRELARLLREEAITHLKLVPSLLRMLLAVPGFGSEPALRQVFCGGEELPADLAAEFLTRSKAELHNLYGPTETCVDVAAHRCGPEDAGRRVPIGREIDNARLVVLDRRGRRLPAGIPGELGVGGLPVARGYLGREDLTRERFVPDPEGSPRDRLYRTGDRVRRRPDGELEFLGRLDEQRKVRGVRIEPGEIEAALRAQPEVADAVAVVRGGERAPSLAAYAAPRLAPADAEDRRALSRTLRERLASVLPRSFVPDTVTVLAALPLTASGKVDRGALPEPERVAPGNSSAPASPEERLLVRIWSEVLGVDGVGIHDNLFDLGGNSLFVFQISARAAQSGYAVTPRLLFEHPTIAELAAAAGTLPATHANVTELTA